MLNAEEVVGRGLARSKTADPASVEMFGLKIATATTTYNRGSQSKTAPHHIISPALTAAELAVGTEASVIGLTWQFLT
jgi:hypothetical protein